MGDLILFFDVICHGFKRSRSVKRLKLDEDNFLILY
jgi:hypothetical protein